MKQEQAKRRSPVHFRKTTRSTMGWNIRLPVLLVLSFAMAASPLLAREKDVIQYGGGLIVTVPFPEAEVVQAVQDVVQDGLIRGTKEYNKDEYVAGANTQTSSRAFPMWTEGGKVFYKQKLHALDPRGFKNSNDAGTITVRYVVLAQDEKSTIVRIDAVFVEDFRRTTHPSDGSVEHAEYKDIHDHIEAAELVKQQTAEAEEIKARRAMPLTSEQQWSSSAGSAASENVSENTNPNSVSLDARPATPPGSSARTRDSQDLPTPISSPAPSGTQESATSAELEPLEKRVQRLRQEVERLVKAPGAPLKSAPFHTAGTLQLLGTGTQVLIVISSPYWYGVETHEGQRGWILRDDLEQVP